VFAVVSIAAGPVIEPIDDSPLSTGALMARIALISDIHGNLEALIAVLREIDAAGVDHLLCLGDVVGYGPDPGPCVDLVSRVCDKIIVGNHDEAALVEDTPANFNPTAALSLNLTRSLLTDSQLETIAEWPMRDELGGVQIAHASFGPRMYAYVMNKRLASESFKGLDDGIGAFGHTHLPAMFACPDGEEPDANNIRGSLPMPADVMTTLPTDHKVLLNPGSVGQPRDRNPDASWGLLDTTERTFRTHRASYDIDATEKKIRDRGLPDFLHERLRVGA
jgi:predicted phosphodiesterase